MSLLASTLSPECRPRRVTVVLAGILVLSLADLVVTLEHLRTVGMFEANPLAVYIIRTTGSAWALATFKLLTVGISTALLWSLRRQRVAEVAAWGALAVMVGLSLSWGRYSASIDHTVDRRIAALAGGADWVQLD